MKRSLSILYHPFLLSLWGTLLLLLLFPVKTNKYTLRITDHGDYGTQHIKQYCDLDNDGTSEAVSVFTNSVGNAGLTVSNTSGVLDQWNFRGACQFTQQDGVVLTGDANRDQVQEIYLFTLSADSILLQIIPDYRKPAVVHRNIFVSRVNRRKGKIDAFIITGEMDDLTGDGFGELVFGIGTGYSLQPRRVFAFDAVRDTFLQSPVSGYFFNHLIQADITGDRAKEIIPVGYAACNVYDTLLPYPDSISWMMVLDKQLNFVFPPVPFHGEYSELRPFALKSASGKSLAGALYLPPLNKALPSRIVLFDMSGSLVSNRIASENPSEVIVMKDKKGHSRFLINRRNVSLILADESFTALKHLPFASSTHLSLLDADRDGVDEIIATDMRKKAVTLFRHDLKHPATATIEGDGQQTPLFSLAERKGTDPLLYIQFGNRYTLLAYAYNKAWPLRFGKYVLLYAGLLLFTVLVRKFQQIQIRQKTEAEQKITDLQLRIVRNQLDPHFTMNAVNSVIAGITAINSGDAKAQLMHFSALHRSLLLDSDRTRRSLKEEIGFTENYLALEKFRFGERFEYLIDIDPAVDIHAEVPKMMLQVYVENALKHGILPLQKKGLLVIRIKGTDPLSVEIRDNGVGRKAAANRNGDDTGMGMQAMEQSFALFGKLGLGKMTAAIDDLYDDSGNPAGTSVVITIHSNHEKR